MKTDFKYLTEAELLSVLAQAKKESARDFAMFLCGYKHAMRASEIADLTLDDLRGEYLTIRRKKGSLQTMQVITPHRGEPLLDEVKAIKNWLKVRPDDGSRAFFISQKGGHLSREQVSRIFRGIAERAGITREKQFVHILKHSRATHLAGNMDLFLLRQALGHRNIQSTMAYAHGSDQKAMEAARAAEMASFRGIL
jgi:type 1 fimbriae regulatory protein FimB